MWESGRPQARRLPRQSSTLPRVSHFVVKGQAVRRRDCPTPMRPFISREIRRGPRRCRSLSRQARLTERRRFDPSPRILPPLLRTQRLRMQPRIPPVIATPRTQQPIAPALELLTTLNARELCRWHPPPLVALVPMLRPPLPRGLPAAVQAPRIEAAPQLLIRPELRHRQRPVATRTTLLQRPRIDPLTCHFTRHLPACNISRQDLAW